jgi:hypothetical protein
MKTEIGHLNEKQLIAAVVAEEGLKEKPRRHLETCSLCRGERDALTSKLDLLGRMAKEFTPRPRKRPAIPLRESHPISFRRMALAAGLGAALLVAFIWGPALIPDPATQMVVELAGDEEMEVFLVDDILDESALPDYYLDMAASSDSYFDDEFMEILVPLEGYDNAV